MKTYEGFSNVAHASIETAATPAVADAASVNADLVLKINSNHVRVSRQLGDYYTRNRTWLQSVFPTKLDKVIMDSQLTQARTDCEFQERILKLATDLKYAACYEQGDAWLKSLKIASREALITFVTERFQSMKSTIEKRRLEFGVYLRQRYQTLETYSDMPELKAAYKASIDREVVDYFAWLDQLLNQFKSSVTERIGDCGQAALPTS